MMSPDLVAFDNEEFKVDELSLKLMNKSEQKMRRLPFLILSCFTISVTIFHFILSLIMVNTSKDVILLISVIITMVLPVIPIVVLTIASFSLGKVFTSKAASVFIPILCGSVDSDYREIRGDLLKRVSGNVLDVGSGDGVYLQYYIRHVGKVKKVVFLEPNIHMHDKITRKIAMATMKHPELKDIEFVINGSFIESFEGENIFDWAILGNVLCEVPNQASILHEINRLVKPGGRLFFSEHVSQPNGTTLKAIQEFLNPWWCCVTDGCNINRHTLDMIKSQYCTVISPLKMNQSWVIKHWEFQLVPIIPFIVGLAVKPK